MPMSAINAQIHLCWIKVHASTSVTDAAPREAPPGALPWLTGLQHLDSAIGIRVGDRPPGMIGALSAGVWQVDDAFSGTGSSPDGSKRWSVTYQPILGSRDDALTWISSNEGEQWLADASVYFLMSFITGDLFAIVDRIKEHGHV